MSKPSPLRCTICRRVLGPDAGSSATLCQSCRAKTEPPPKTEPVRQFVRRPKRV